MPTDTREANVVTKAVVLQWRREPDPEKPEQRQVHITNNGYPFDSFEEAEKYAMTRSPEAHAVWIFQVAPVLGIE